MMRRWGDSQKTRADETWAPLLHSTNEITNAEVWGPDDKGEKPDAMMADWAQQQRLYYAQLLKPEAAAKLDKLLPSCTVEQVRRLKRMFHRRTLTAVPLLCTSCSMPCPLLTFSMCTVARCTQRSTHYDTHANPSPLPTC